MIRNVRYPIDGDEKGGGRVLATGKGWAEDMSPTHGQLMSLIAAQLFVLGTTSHRGEATEQKGKETAYLRRPDNPRRTSSHNGMDRHSQELFDPAKSKEACSLTTFSLSEPSEHLSL